MSTQKIASLLAGVAFVGMSLSGYIFAPNKEEYGILLLVVFIMGMVMTWKGVWGEED